MRARLLAAVWFYFWSLGPMAVLASFWVFGARTKRIQRGLAVAVVIALGFIARDHFVGLIMTMYCDWWFGWMYAPCW